MERDGDEEQDEADAECGIGEGFTPQPAFRNQQSDDLLIYPDNWPAVQVFFALANCWRVDYMAGRYLGIDRPAIESTMRMMGVKRKRRGGIFEDLRVMENAALEALNDKA